MRCVVNEVNALAHSHLSSYGWQQGRAGLENRTVVYRRATVNRGCFELEMPEAEFLAWWEHWRREESARSWIWILIHRDHGVSLGATKK